VFEAAAPKVGNFETTGEQRICCMAPRPNRDSTLVWRKSYASADAGGCVEVAISGPSVLVRDSRDPMGSMLALTYAEWHRLLRHIKSGAADPVRGRDVG